MRRLSYQQFQQEQSTFEELVLKTDYLAKFCSLQPWQIAAFENLHGPEFEIDRANETLVITDESNWLVFTERQPGVLYPFESAWMFGCPLVGDPQGCLDLLVNSNQHFGGLGFVISGLRKDSVIHRGLNQLGGKARRYETFETTNCLTIDLSEGFDAYLQRRSKSFRKGIRQMKDLEGLSIVDASSEAPEKVLARILDIQKRSYKGDSMGGDIFSSDHYLNFYSHLYESLYQRGAIKTLFAQVEDGSKDIAYIMGAVVGDIYRGFQMSYDNEYRKFALGNRLQLENMRQVCDRGVSHYDLGMYSEYKERWADNLEEYRGVFIVL